jgi:broad specificity phosphatase PhoE
MDNLNRNAASNFLIVSHGLTMRFVLMRYFRWSVEVFDQVWNPSNCEIWCLEKVRSFRMCPASFDLPCVTRRTMVRTSW